MSVAVVSPSIAELRLRYPEVFRRARGRRFLPLLASRTQEEKWPAVSPPETNGLKIAFESPVGMEIEGF